MNILKIQKETDLRFSKKEKPNIFIARITQISA